MSSSVVARVTEIWRYPVSSLGGERVACADLTEEGVEGDREFGLIDASTGQPAAPEREVRWRKALHLRSRCVAGEVPKLSFPDDRTYSLDDATLNAALTDYFGFEVAIASHGNAAELAGFPLTQFRHHHFPMHVLTTASLDHLAHLSRRPGLDSRRFRPSVLIELQNGGGFAEDAWIGSNIRIGDVELVVQEKSKRCGVTFISQPGIDEDPEILRNILRHNSRSLGVYCTVERRGTVRMGDRVSVET